MTTCVFALHNDRYRCANCGYITPIPHARPPLRTCSADAIRREPTAPQTQPCEPCEHRGQPLGTIYCGCGGEPTAFGCGHPDNALPACTLHAINPRRKEIRRPGAAAILFTARLSVCALCPHTRDLLDSD